MQQVNGGAVSSQTVEDIGTYNTLIYERLTVPGIPPAAASFQFADACPSSDFFSPVHAANEMMELLGLTSTSGCSILGSLDSGSQLTLTTDQWNTVYEYLSEGRIVTNVVTQSEETLIVIDLVANAPSDEDVFVSIEGDRLIVTGLDPISAPSGLVHWPISAQSVSMDTNLMILGLLQNSHDIVAQVLDASAEHGLNGPDPQPGYGVHQAQALLLGGAANGHPSRADLVENALALYLQNTFPQADVAVDHIDAVWGVYGILPLAVVSTPDAYLLVDTTNGQVAGPFEPDSNFYADDLLAFHTSVFDSASPKPVYFDRKGCTRATAPRWRLTPTGPTWQPKPPCTDPNCLVPPFLPPGSTNPLPLNPSNPGWFSDWSCSPGPWTGGPSGSATCVCVTYGKRVSTGGEERWVRQTCKLNYPCSTGTPAPGLPGNQYPGPSGPGQPPFDTPGSGYPGAAWQCEESIYWYW